MAISSSEGRVSRRDSAEDSARQHERNLEAARLLATWRDEGSDAETAYLVDFERTLDAARRG